MKWSVANAKAKLSEVVQRANRAPQIIENRGHPVAVVLSPREFERLRQASEMPKATPMSTWLDWVDGLKTGTELDLMVPKRELDSERQFAFEDE